MYLIMYENLDTDQHEREIYRSKVGAEERLTELTNAGYVYDIKLYECSDAKYNTYKVTETRVSIL